MMYNERFWRETVANAAQKAPDAIAEGRKVQTAKQLNQEQKKELSGKFLQMYFALDWMYCLQGKTISDASDLAFTHMKTMFAAMKLKEPLNPAIYELNNLVDKEIAKSKDSNRKRYDFVAPWVAKASKEEIEDSRKQTAISVNRNLEGIKKFCEQFKMQNQINPLVIQAMMQRQRSAA